MECGVPWAVAELPILLLFAVLNFHLQNTSVHGVNAFYSTPTEYARAKLSYPVTWPSVNGSDGFPYADGPHSYWSGFFTSRPALKGYVRACSAQFQALKQLQVWSGGAEDMSASNPLYLLERALGVAQHHDAVAGTEQQHVAFNYALRLAQGRTAADALVASSFANLTGFADAPFLTCDLANATICAPLESGTVTTAVGLYNSQAQRKGALPVRIPVGLPPGVASYAVTSPDGTTPVQAQIVPASPADEELRVDYYNASASPVAWLVWQADVPAAGFAVYFVTPVASADTAPHTAISTLSTLGAADTVLANGVLTLTISAATGMLSKYSNAMTNVKTMLSQEWCWYNASAGNNVEDSQV